MPTPPDAPHIKFTADHLNYERANSLIHLKGNVRIQESTWTLKGDELWIDMKSRAARSEGYLLVEDGVTALHGDSGEFDFSDHSGTLVNASAGHADWRVHAKRMQIDHQRRLEYRSADFTSCSFDPKPHYHFHSSYASVVPKKHLLAYNVFFYVGRIPVFYMPVLYKSLKTAHFLRFKIQPGYDRRNGGFLKSTLTTQHGEAFRSKLFIDYYSAQGLGIGAEMHRRKGEDSRGVLSAYRIRETSNKAERWSLTGDLYQSLTSSFSLQGRLQFQSDADFNNHYARASALRVTPELINSGAVVYRLPSATARVSYSRLDTADASRQKFIRDQESYPRLEIQSADLRFGRLPWINTLSGFADNSFDRGRGYQQKSAGAAWQGTQTIVLKRGLSFTPRMGYSQTYYDRLEALTSWSSTRTFQDAAVGRYSAQGTLRLSSFAGDSDLTHAFARRQKPGSFSDDAGALDHGIETNLLSLEHAYRPVRKVLVRLSSGYDFRVFRDQYWGFRRRVEPVVGEVVYTPRSSLNLAVRDDYQLFEGNRSFLFSGTLGDEEAKFLSVGAGYNRIQADRYFLNTEFGWANSSHTFHVTTALRTEVACVGGFGGLHDARVFEKEFSVIKHWHDFYTKLSARFRPGGVKEASIRIDLKFGGFSADQRRVHDWESEWFPERRNGREERP